jgi:transposase-like protein
MAKRGTFSAQEKYELILAFDSREFPTRDFKRHYGVAVFTIRKWKYLYETYGIEGLQKAKGWKHYSKELKLAAIKDYLSGNYSLIEVIRKYEISSGSVLEKWIKNYNGHREFRGTRKRTENSMTKGRSTKLEERIEIVKYCLEKGKDYNQTAQKYNVSYQQVYQWVKKYMENGQDGLEDKRGHRKEENELTPEEKIQREMKQLEQENERLRAEIAFLKKLEELERRRHR